LSHGRRLVFEHARREYWRHKVSGEVWAVELVGDIVVACAGPITLDPGSDNILDYLPFDTRDLHWFRQITHEFERVPTRP
jgi:hypothetical protein